MPYVALNIYQHYNLGTINSTPVTHTYMIKHRHYSPYLGYNEQQPITILDAARWDTYRVNRLSGTKYISVFILNAWDLVLHPSPIQGSSPSHLLFHISSLPLIYGEHRLFHLYRRPYIYNSSVYKILFKIKTADINVKPVLPHSTLTQRLPSNLNKILPFFLKW